MLWQKKKNKIKFSQKSWKKQKQAMAIKSLKVLTALQLNRTKAEEDWLLTSRGQALELDADTKKARTPLLFCLQFYSVNKLSEIFFPAWQPCEGGPAYPNTIF